MLPKFFKWKKADIATVILLGVISLTASLTAKEWAGFNVILAVAYVWLKPKFDEQTKEDA